MGDFDFEKCISMLNALEVIQLKSLVTDFGWKIESSRKVDLLKQTTEMLYNEKEIDRSVFLSRIKNFNGIQFEPGDLLGIPKELEMCELKYLLPQSKSNIKFKELPFFELIKEIKVPTVIIGHKNINSSFGNNICLIRFIKIRRLLN